MTRSWSQVNVDRWTLLERVDPEADASQFVIAHIWSSPDRSIDTAGHGKQSGRICQPVDMVASAAYPSSNHGKSKV